MVDRNCGDFKWVSWPSSSAYKSRTTPQYCSFVWDSCSFWFLHLIYGSGNALKCIACWFFSCKHNSFKHRLFWCEANYKIAIGDCRKHLCRIKCENKLIILVIFFLLQVTCGRCHCRKPVRSNHSHQIDSILSVSYCF